MKKTIMIMLAAATLAVSCTKEAAIDNSLNDGKILVISGAINDAEPGTKAEFTKQNGLTWNANDAIELARVDAKAWEEDIQSNAAVITEGYRKAAFTIDASKLTSGKSYKPYYPASGWTTGYGKAAWTVAAAQTQWTSDKLENGRFFLIGTSAIDYSGTEDKEITDAYFNLVGTAIRFLVYGSTDATETITSVTISLTNENTLRTYTNIVSGELYSDNTAYSEDAGRFSATVTLSGYTEYANAASKEDAKGIFAVICPNYNYDSVWNRSGNTYTYTVVTNKKTYTFVSTTPKIYEGGKMYEMPLNLTKATSSVGI